MGIVPWLLGGGDCIIIPKTAPSIAFRPLKDNVKNAVISKSGQKISTSQKRHQDSKVTYA